MKFRFIFPLVLLTIIINVIGQYNQLMALLSIFILVITSFANLFIFFIKIAKKNIERIKNKRTIDVNVGRNQFTLFNDTIMAKEIAHLESGNNRIIFTVSMIIIWILGIVLMTYQIVEYIIGIEPFTNELIINPHHFSSPILMFTGYVLFVASLIAMLFHFRKLYREESFFQLERRTNYKILKSEDEKNDQI